jgi:hypothetical protein
MRADAMSAGSARAAESVWPDAFDGPTWTVQIRKLSRGFKKGRAMEGLLMSKFNCVAAVSFRATLVPALLSALCLLLCSELPAFSKSGGVDKDDPWNPHHIDNLPVEIRQYITGICTGPPSAQHDFATYSPHEKRWRINLEYLRCNGLGEYPRGNQCLDVDFVEVGSRFRLARKQYRDCGF